MSAVFWGVVVRDLGVVLAVLLVSSAGWAQEAVHLEHLEQVRVGSASLVAGDEVRRAEEDRTDDPRGDDGGVDDASDARPDVYVALRGALTSGSKHVEGWKPPFVVGSAQVELGAFRKPGSTADLDSRLFVYAPDGERETVAISGRHRFVGNLHAWIDGVHANLGLALGLAHGSDGARGLRALEIAPAPYRRFTAAPTLWLTFEDDDDEDRYGVALDYAIDDRRYLDDGPVIGFRAHRVGVGVGLVDEAFGRLGTLRLLDLGYVHTELAGRAAAGLADAPVARIHRFEVAGLKGRGHFGYGSDLAHHYGRATAGGSLGWAFLWQEPFVAAVEKDVRHTPDLSLDVAYEDYEIGRIGAAVGHRPGLTPDGREMLGITFAELEARVAPNDVPLGGSLAGTLARVEPLPLGERAARFHARADLEIFGRVGLLELGPRGTIGHGVPTGTMGWQLSEPLDWYGSLGAFARLSGP